MDVKLENLIEKIKQEGVDEAKRESEDIVNKAREKGQSLIKEAEAKAKRIIEQAQAKSRDFEKNSHSALQQASRDLVLVLRNKIQELFDRAFKKEIAKTLDADFLKKLIVKILEDWAKGKKTKFLVNSKDADKLKELVLSGVRKEAKDNIVIKVDDRVSKGFRIGVDGESVYYDFTYEGIAEALGEFLNPALQKILNDNG